MGFLTSVITQNVDGLHQAAGSTNVIEYHGTHRTLSCLECGSRVEGTAFSEKDLPALCPRCRSFLKPDVVFFGEPIPWKAQILSTEACRSCSTLLVIGTSALVYPAAHLPATAKGSGATIIEVNMEPTPLTDGISDYLIQGSAGRIIPALVEEIKGLLSFRGNL